MKKKQILIVEDERIVAEGIKMSLQELGYCVSGVVSSGEEAIIEVKENNVDLVLMDITLRGEMNGIEAATRIHARFDIPFVYLTAHADDKTMERAKITEPFGYIFKPYENRDLHSTIMKALCNHRMGNILNERTSI